MVNHLKIDHLDEKIALDAADISIRENLAMADSIVLATAKFGDAKVVTSDRHFSKAKENIAFIE